MTKRINYLCFETESYILWNGFGGIIMRKICSVNTLLLVIIAFLSMILVFKDTTNHVVA